MIEMIVVAVSVEVVASRKIAAEVGEWRNCSMTAAVAAGVTQVSMM